MKDKINYKKVNEVVSLTSKILNLVYIAMIIGIIFIATLLIKEWGILKFVMTILKVATPFFIGFVIAWLFNPLVVKLENRGWNRAIASMVIFLVFIPSAIRYWLDVKVKINNPYDAIWFEGSASSIGEYYYDT